MRIYPASMEDVLVEFPRPGLLDNAIYQSGDSDASGDSDPATIGHVKGQRSALSSETREHRRRHGASIDLRVSFCVEVCETC